MSAEKIIADWKNKKFKPVYWLEGDEPFFIDEIMNYAEHHLLSESEASFNLTIFYGKDADWASVLNACMRYPMFGERQVVLLKEAQQMKDIERLENFLKFMFSYVKRIKYHADFSIEFRNDTWFNDNVYNLLKKYNTAVAISDTPSWPMTKEITADFTYIRFHGPGQLFGSLYTNKQMDEWAKFILSQKSLKKVYVYFNNDINVYAIKNGDYLQKRIGKGRLN